MKISTNQLAFLNQHYGSAGNPASDGVEALVEKIGAQLGAVEEVVPFGERFKDVRIVKVVSCEDHPDADRLHVCKVDDSRQVQGVERDEDGLVQIVCGAPNVREGMWAAWLPPGSTVPSTFYGPDPFVLEARPLRGVVSNGMMASPKELTIGDSHEGILEITKDFDEQNLTPGIRFAEAYHLDGDHVIDIENKMFTHRPDCFGLIGVAREIEGISGRVYKSPAWYTPAAEVPGMETEELSLEVRNEISQLVPRFTAITMRNVTVKASPMWLQLDLTRAGMRPINNIVDYTNIFMLETGQPIHAYDYDKVKALSQGGQATLVIRHPREGEKINLLNGKQIEPRQEAIMIATDKQLIGVGGVMGGADTEVDEHTKNIIIEVANFDMYSVRRTSMAHGLFTDAVTRFNKGQSPLQTRVVLAKMVEEVRTFADGKVACALIDDNHLPPEVMERASLYTPVQVSRTFINERLGLQLASEEMAQLLTNVEFKVKVQGDDLTVTAPFWRTDIELREDLVEEVGRLYGYDKLPLDLPKRDLTPAAKDPMLEFKAAIRACLARAGANEVLTYSFVHGNLLDKVGQNRDQAFRLSNALSPDLQYFRQSLTPSLLEKVHSNVKAGNDTFVLFEIGKSHNKLVTEAGTGLPSELSRVACVLAANDKVEKSGAPYYAVRKYVLDLLAALGLATRVTFELLDTARYEGATAAKITQYEPGRTAVIRLGDVVVGEVGEYKAAVRKSLKLPAYCAGFELDLDVLLAHHGAHRPYVALPRFPKVEQDICLRVPANMPYQQVFDFVLDHLVQNRPDKTYHTLAPVDIYQREDDKEHKQITVRLSLASYERTLTDQEVAKLLDAVAAAAHEQLNAERM
jgi:phenylalanyl-tRNA synthetase beta chain